MAYLLDTHVLLWSLFEPDKLNKKITSTLLDLNCRIFVSMVSFWEIAIKYSLGKLELTGDVKPDDLLDSCKQSGFDSLNLEPETLLSYYRLPKTEHKDPFDRLLIWQAIKNDIIIISQDKSFQLYCDHGLRIL
jgi:PIN domain nuclease of toxin-antitoxin system